MKNLLGLSFGFFTEPSVEKWKSALDAGFTEAEIGIGDVQMARNLDKYLETAESQYKILIAAGINASSFHLPFWDYVDVSGPGDSIADSAVDRNKKILDWVGEKGIGIAVLHASWEPISPEDRPARLDRAVKSIKILGDYAKAKKITLAIEDLPRTCLGNCADEMLILTGHGKNASICFDVNHLLVEHQRDFMAKTAPYIVTTHFSDYDRKDERHWFPGDGDIDWKELIGLFDKAGYKGRYIFEIGEDSSPKLGRVFSPAELAARFKSLA